MTVTDADRLAAAGAALTIDGRAMRVRYTSRSFKLLEDRYGSIAKLGPLFEQIQSGEAPTFDTVFFLLSIGLRHEEGITEDWLLDNAPPAEINEYMTAVASALQEASPAAPEGEAVDPTKASPNGSTGKHGSGSRSRTSIAALPNSGTA